MKIFKLIKSINYVSYPVYKEIVKISDAVSNSIGSFRDMLIATIVGIMFDKTPLSKALLNCIANKFPSDTAERITSNENYTILLSIFIAVTIFLLFKLVYIIKTRWGKNNNTKKKRDKLVYEFYNVAIPQLIEIKSIIEEIQENHFMEQRKKTFLLLIAKHEIVNLNRILYDMRIIENDKTGLQTNDSYTLLSRISKCAYINFVEEMLDILFIIFTELSQHCAESAKEDINEIRTIINSSGVFDQVYEIDFKLTNIRSKINCRN